MRTLFLESGKVNSLARDGRIAGHLKDAVEIGEHEFSVLKRNVQESNLGQNILGSYEHYRG